MHVQQQHSSNNKTNKSPTCISNNSLVTIEQIYQIDTITLQELIDEFQKQPFFKDLNNIQKLKFQTKNCVSSKFTHLSSRQLKKWYHIAKIQLNQRQKIQQFALKLIQENIDPNYYDINLTLSNIQIPTKLNITIPTKFNIQIPPINQKQSNKSNLHSQSNHVNKPSTNQQTKITQIKTNNKQTNVINRLSQQVQKNVMKQKHNIFNPTQIKTIEVKNTTNEIFKDQKVLSKKQFLQMMKIKLNQGSDYKTRAFIKEPLRKSQNQSKKKLTQQIDKKHTHHNNQVFAVKNKSKSVYYPPKEKINSQSKNTSRQIISEKVKENEIKMTRYKNNSSYTSRKQTMNSISGSNRIESRSIRTMSKGQTSRTVPVSRMGRGNGDNSEKFIDKKMQVNLQRQGITTIDKEQDSQIATNNHSQNQVDESIQIARQKQQIVNDSKQVQPKLVKSVIIDKEKHEKKQVIFVENQDAYDDEPETLQKQIALKRQQNKNSHNDQNQIQGLIQQEQEQKVCQFQQQQQQSIDQDLPIIESEQGYFNHCQQQIDNSFTQNNKQSLSHQDDQVKSSHNKLQQTHKSLQSSQHSQPSQTQNTLIPKQKHSHQNHQYQFKYSSKSNTLQNFYYTENDKTSQSSISITKKKTVYLLPQIQKPITIKPKYPPYHLHFPTFYHLFHYTKPQTASTNNIKFSLPHLLKSLQLSLQNYFQKQVLKIAKNHHQNKITLSNININNSTQNTENQPNIQLKCITQLQFINSTQNSSIFDIDLSSFKSKSISLLKKLQKNTLYEFSQQKSTKLQQKDGLKQNQHQADPYFYRVVKNKPQVYDIINTSFYRTQNWLQLPHGMQLHGCWNLLWTWSKPQIDFNTLIKFQKVNHFPGSKQLARKDLLKKNIQKIKKLSKKLNDQFDIIPDTYFLPGQNKAFIKKFRQSESKGRNLWILKPVGLSRGRGISLVSKLQDVVFSEPIVMQKYIDDPFLLEGYKFDLRIYVLVTSINPLQCFIYKQGFARVSTQRYCNDIQQIGNKYVHLTNYSIQKESMKCPDIFSRSEKQLGGCKLSLKMLRQRLDRKCINWQNIWQQIKQVILKSLISCMKYIPENSNCFQLFGYDIMLDNKLKCWLIEVNSSPSLQQDFLIDQIIKQQLIDDTIQILDPINFNRQQLLKVIKRRRKQIDGMKSHINYANNSIQQLDQDLYKILNGKLLRNYGEIKSHTNFQCIAPGNKYQKILKTVQTFTHDPFVRKNNFFN